MNLMGVMSQEETEMNRRLGIRVLLGALIVMLVFGGCGGMGHLPGDGPSPDVEISAAQSAEVFRVLDLYMDALNALDLDAHVSTYHFPHFRYAGGRIVVWQTPEEAMPILSVEPGDRRERLRRALEPDWHRSVWVRREIVQADETKVHVATRFHRLREDGSVIKRFDSLYVLSLEVDEGGFERWGIKGRSSFAP